MKGWAESSWRIKQTKTPSNLPALIVLALAMKLGDNRVDFLKMMRIDAGELLHFDHSGGPTVLGLLGRSTLDAQGAEYLSSLMGFTQIGGVVGIGSARGAAPRAGTDGAICDRAPWKFRVGLEAGPPTNNVWVLQYIMLN